MSNGLDFETVEKLLSSEETLSSTHPGPSPADALSEIKSDILGGKASMSGKDSIVQSHDTVKLEAETKRETSAKKNLEDSKRPHKSSHGHPDAEAAKHSSSPHSRRNHNGRVTKSRSPHSSSRHRDGRSSRHRHSSSRRSSQSIDRRHRRSRSSDRHSSRHSPGHSSSRYNRRSSRYRRRSSSSSSSRVRVPSSQRQTASSTTNTDSSVSQKLPPEASADVSGRHNSARAPSSAVGALSDKPVERVHREDEMRKNLEIEEARRDDLTALIMNLNLAATERDIYEFFAEHAGKVRDIQCIKDQRSGKPKGVAYIEFYEPGSVVKALALSDQKLMGQPIKVQASQAEKNRAAKAAKIQQSELTDGPMKLFVGGLVDVLSNISADEIKQIFSPFGEILSVEIQRDPYTGRSKGFAFVHFQRSSEAKDAMTALSGYVLAGRPLKVGYATESAKFQSASQADQIAAHISGLTAGKISPHTTIFPPPSATGQLTDYYSQQFLLNQQLKQQSEMQDSDRLDDDGGGLLSGPGSKLLLMQKLQRGGEVTGINQIPNTPNVNAPYSDPAIALAEHQARLLAGQAYAFTKPMAPAPAIIPEITTNLILKNMFSPNSAEVREDPDFFSDLIEEATTECSKYGQVIQIYIKQQIGQIDGTLWVKFANSDQSQKAYAALHGRYFAYNQISIQFANDQEWNAYTLS